jgi:RNA polymerase sigma-70 factor (ECF subfamily)
MRTTENIKLIQKAKRRDPDAFTELINLYMKDMYRVAIAILMNDEDAADAIQETILTCWERLSSLRDNKLFKTWMTRILINKCYDIRNHRIEAVDISEHEELAFHEEESNLEIKEALEQLDEKYRVPIMMFYGDGYSTKEIASILHAPVSTIQTRLSRGREQLGRYFINSKE